MLGRKGQVEAPFELLVAVIIMGFVIFVSFYAMGKLNEDRCKNEVDNALNKFRMDLETAISSPLTPIYSEFRSGQTCFPKKTEQVKLQDWDTLDRCRDYCKSNIALCTLLEYSNEGYYYNKMCVDISVDTVFPSIPGERCIDLSEEGYALVDVSQEIPEGSYLLINKSTLSGTDAGPTVCAYIKT